MNPIYLDTITKYYGDKKAKRSGVPYINHINEGLTILYLLNASDVAKEAFCIHPMLQEDLTLESNMNYLRQLDPIVLMTCMEYRNISNRGRYSYQIDDPNNIYLGPLKDVRDMLIADKIQNRKDFIKYHILTHPKSNELTRYFRNWLIALKVTEIQYDRIVSLLED